MSDSEELYSLYRGDEFLFLGTLEELSQEFDINPETIKFYARPSNYKRMGDSPNRLCAVKVGHLESYKMQKALKTVKARHTYFD